MADHFQFYPKGLVLRSCIRDTADAKHDPVSGELLLVSTEMIRTRMIQFRRLLFAGLCLTLFLGPGATAEEKQADKKDLPRLTVLSPLAVTPGTTTTLYLRGFNLDAVKDAALLDAPAGSKIVLKSMGKATNPKDDYAKRYGDTEVEIELSLPESYLPDSVDLTLTLSNSAKPLVQKVQVTPRATLVDEREPNGGFKAAQSIPSACVIRGAINEDKDVDVYRFSGKAGQTIRLEVFGERMGSMLDAAISLYDDRGHLLTTQDDGPAGKDPVIQYKLSADGDYLIGVIDVSDRGGTRTHPYLLNVGLDSPVAPATDAPKAN